MICQQKSGVFLNISCNNSVEGTCSHCKKEVCSQHKHLFESKHYCENCFWEFYIFSQKERTFEEDFHDYDTVTTSYLPTNYDQDEIETSDGFGGGSGGGGGATGKWTPSEVESFNEQRNFGEEVIGNDDTFFYS